MISHRYNSEGSPVTLSYMETLRAEMSPLSITLTLAHPDAPAGHLLPKQTSPPGCPLFTLGTIENRRERESG